MQSNTATRPAKQTPIAYVVVDHKQGGVHHGEPHKTRRAAEGAAYQANVDAGTATRFEARSLFA